MNEKTMQNLADAFSGEAQATMKYTFFAEVADKEGHPNVAKLFRAAAEAEKIHARNHLRNMGKLKTTAENLQQGIEGETYEFTHMYPDFIKDAQQTGEKGVEKGFHFANEAEKSHAEVYAKALKNLEAKGSVQYYLCTVCGYIAEDEAPDTCPVCGAKKSAFKLAE